jgi:hypothetical protein
MAGAIGWRIAFWRWSRAGGIGSRRAGKRELDQQVRPGVADMLDGHVQPACSGLAPGGGSGVDGPLGAAAGFCGLRCH